MYKLRVIHGVENYRGTESINRYISVRECCESARERRVSAHVSCMQCFIAQK